MLITLLVIIFWAVIPGLITGWMLRERGWSFPPAFLLGAVFGPIGILLTLALISAGSLRSKHRHGQGSRGAHGRAFRVYYDVPVVGRLHVSTVWALAGLATFTCVWMLAGLGYEFYVARQGGEMKKADSQSASRTDAAATSGAASPAQVATQGEPKPSEGQPPSASSSPSSPLMNSLAGQPRQTAQMAAGSVNAPPQLAQPSPFGPTVLTASGSSAPPSSSTESAPPKTPAEVNAAPPAPPVKVSAQGREAAVGEVTRSLGAAGHRVHAALSGDAQTATLSLSGATLTRAAGNQLVSRSRATLKAAGIRIVVMVNGQESWTYIL